MKRSSEFGAALAAARAAWPGLEVPEEAFGAFLREREGADHIEDLYLTCACARGDRNAIGRFESRYFGEVDAVVRRLRAPEGFADELKQRLRVKLFVAQGDRPPKIADYAGRGDLARWLRAVAMRTGLNLLRGRRREVAEDEADLEEPFGEDPELQWMRSQYAGDFRAAFGEAVEALEPRELLFLRHYYVDALTLEQIAALYGVHAATVSRALRRARGNLLAGTQRALKARLGAQTAEVDSLLRLLDGGAEAALRLTLSRLLG